MQGWGVGDVEAKIEITYIVPFLALGVVESAGFAVVASLGMVPVVPRSGTVGAWGQRGAGRLLSVCLVLGIQSGKTEAHSVNHNQGNCDFIKLTCWIRRRL